MAFGPEGFFHRSFPLTQDASYSSSLEDDRHVLTTLHHSTATMSGIPTTTAPAAARLKPLIGDGFGRYRILIVGNSGTSLPRTHTYE